MLEFSKLTLKDMTKLRPLIIQKSSNLCNYTVGNIFMWRDYHEMEYAVHNDTVIFKAQTKYGGVTTVFSLPLGKDWHGEIDEVVKYCKHHNIPVAFYAVTNEEIDILASWFKEYRLFSKEDWSDYIYHATDLTTLAGRKYSKKRNHINNFKKAYTNYSFEEINENNLQQIRDFYERLSADNVYDSDTAKEDHIKTLEVLDNYALYDLLGGVLLINNNIAAFSIGEIKANTLHIHIEKADHQYNGVHQVLSNEFAKKYTTDGIEFINREEDDGDLGLRQSKLSYYPCEIAEKHIFVVVARNESSDYENMYNRSRQPLHT